MVADSLLIWGVAFALYSWFSTWTGFFVIASAKRVRKAGVKIPHGGRLVVYIWLALGGPGDFVYNALIGSFVYLELPKWHRGELLYSHRIERLANKSSGWRRAKAYPLALMLNAADPEHIDLPA
jgi:hypothetical protein